MLNLVHLVLLVNHAQLLLHNLPVQLALSHLEVLLAVLIVPTLPMAVLAQLLSSAMSLNTPVLGTALPALPAMSA